MTDADMEPGRHGHKHQPEWNAERTTLYLHVPGHVATCGIVEWSESTQQWWWWCLHSSCNEARPSESSTLAWSDFLGHEWGSHLSSVVVAGGVVANGPEPSLDAAIRAACLPNMRKQLNGEDITAGDIAAEQAALDAIRGDAAP